MRKTWVRAKRGDKNLLIECACGCGKIRHLFDHKRRIHAYISGHNARGKRSGNWKGGRIVDRKGYSRIWNYKRNSYAMEHRKVFEEYYSCSLLSWVDIHHIDGDRLNNRIENLKPMTHIEHTRLENATGIKAVIFHKVMKI